MTKIAYIDDSEADRELAEIQGFEVFSPEDYKLAQDYEIVVVDLLLGSEELLDQVLEYLKDNKVILASGVIDLREFYNVDHYPFIGKPISKKKVFEVSDERGR